MSEVVALPGCVAPDQSAHRQPQQEVIEFIERLLADARSGEIQAIAMASVCADGHTADGWANTYGTATHRLMASISYLHVRFAQTVNMRARVPQNPPEGA